MATSPDTILRLQAGIEPLFAMLAGMQMEVLTLLADGPRSASNLAETLGVAEERLSRLLHVLVVSRLLEKREDGFANTEEAAEFLVKGRSGYLGGIHELLSQLWHADLLTSQSIRSGKPAAREPHFRDAPRQAHAAGASLSVIGYMRHLELN